MSEGQQVQRLTKHCPHHCRHLFAFLTTHTNTRALPRASKEGSRRSHWSSFILVPPTQSSQQKSTRGKAAEAVQYQTVAAWLCGGGAGQPNSVSPVYFLPNTDFFSAGLAGALQSTPTDAAHRSCGFSGDTRQTRNPSQR